MKLNGDTTLLKEEFKLSSRLRSIVLFKVKNIKALHK